MHIPHNISHLAGAMQPSALQTLNARKPAEKRLLKTEDDFDSLLDIVILGDHGEQEDGDEEPGEDGRG